MKARVAECNLASHTVITLRKPCNESDEAALIVCTHLTVRPMRQRAVVVVVVAERKCNQTAAVMSLKIGICIFPSDPTAIQKVHSRVGSQ